MLILKTIYPIKAISFIFSYLAEMLLCLIGFGLIVFAIYMKIKDLNFRKNGVPVKLKVKKVEEISKSYDNGRKIAKEYKVTFEFDDDGSIKEETLTTLKKFKVGSVKEGIYLANARHNVLSVAGEGFYLAKGGEIFMISFGLLILFLVAHMLFEFSPKIVIYVVLAYFASFFVILYLFPLFFKNKRKRTKKDDVNEIYYSDANSDEYSTVNQSLVRYIPKVKEYKNSKISFALIMFFVIFVGLGTLLSVIGLMGTNKAINIRLTYPSVIGEISDTYNYTVKDEDGESKLIGIICNYDVDGRAYNLDYKTGKGEIFFNYKIGDKVKLYYDKNNPSNAVPKNELAISVVPLMMGIMFVYFGIYIIIYDRKKTKLYSTYIRMVEK